MIRRSSPVYRVFLDVRETAEITIEFLSLLNTNGFDLLPYDICDLLSAPVSYPLEKH